MTAIIIDFIPSPNPNRPTLEELETNKVIEFLSHAPALVGRDLERRDIGDDWDGYTA